LHEAAYFLAEGVLLIREAQIHDHLNSALQNLILQRKLS
jgi:hypothetical protein